MTDLEIRKRALVKRLLEVKDDRVLGHVEEILGGAAAFRLSAAQLKGLDEQLKAYLSGEAKSYTWGEVKEYVARKRKRA